MAPIIIRRLAQGFIVIVGVTLVTFFLMRLIPGDPVRILAAQGNTEALARVRAELGLDQSIWVQLGIFLSGAVRGDLGTCYFQPGHVQDYILQRLPLTGLLTGVAMAMALIVAVPLGVYAAVRRNTGWDRGILGLVLVFQSMPNFWVALVLIIVVAVQLKWAPAVGYAGPNYVILPAIALALTLIAVLTRVIRGNLMDVLESDYIKAARARGIPKRRIIWTYGFKNILVPLLTVIGAQIGYLLGGAVIIEYIFNYPGLGLLTISAVLRRDYPLVQGIVIVTSLIFVMINLIVDIGYGYMDPRMRKRT